MLVDDGVTGILVEPNNATALAHALLAALADPARLMKLGEAGRQLVAREYTWPRQVKRTRIMLEALAGDPLGAALEPVTEAGETNASAAK